MTPSLEIAPFAFTVQGFELKPSAALINLDAGDGHKVFQGVRHERDH